MTHGTVTSYTKGHCRCLRCQDAWRDYQRQYYRDRAAGRLRTVPAAEALHHVSRLRAAGMTRAAVARAAGIDHLTIKRIETGKRKRLNRRSHNAILGVRVGTNPPDSTNSAADAQRLIDAMHAAGFTSDELEQRLHITSIERIARQKHVRPKTWAKLTVFYLFLARQGLVPADLLQEVAS